MGDQRTVSLTALLPLMEEAFARGQGFILPVTGVSMVPTLSPNGDTVTLLAVAPQEVRRGDIVLYRRENGAFILHRVVRAHRDTLDFCGDGQVELERGVARSAVIARVSGARRGGSACSERELRRLGRRRLCSRPLRRLATAYYQRRAAR